MKIVSFGINNFRGIHGGLEQNTIRFDDSNTIFLFGQNNVGKSTFLHAYETYYENKAITANDFHKQDSAKTIEFQLEVEFDENDLQRVEEVAPTKVESLKKYLKDGRYLLVKRYVEGKQQKDTVKPEPPVNYTYNPENKTWDDKNYGSIGLDNVFQALLPTPIFIKAMPTEEELESIVNKILQEKAKRQLEDKERKELQEAKEAILKLQNKMYNPESISQYKNAVNEHFQKVFPDTQIEFEDEDSTRYTPDKLGKKFKLHFNKLDVDGKKDESIPTAYENIGHGAVRTAIFTLLLMQDVADEYKREKGRKDFLVLFEEPELFLHPKLMRELRELIYKVSDDDYPYQLLCASHSPQMIDISKPKSSLVRMISVKEAGTKLFQIDEEYLKSASNTSTTQELKQELYEVLRFNPYICESFYSDEVILLEGPTEEIIARGYFEEKSSSKNFFIINCGSVTNIPFYQRVFSKFFIKYHVICDSDGSAHKGIDENGFVQFSEKIQKSIYEQLVSDTKKEGYKTGLFRIHEITFEPAHRVLDIDENLRMDSESGNGKPFDANKYWKEKLHPNIDNEKINKVPIIRYLNEITSSIT